MQSGLYHSFDLWPTKALSDDLAILPNQEDRRDAVDTVALSDFIF